MTLPEDKILISSIECLANIGVPAQERAAKQQLLVDLEFPTDSRRAAASDNIKDAVDYGAVAERVAQVCASREFQLIETLADEIAASLLEKFPIGQVRVVVRKLAPVPSPRVAYVSIAIERQAGSL